jgi:hypothetical protein
MSNIIQLLDRNSIIFLAISEQKMTYLSHIGIFHTTVEAAAVVRKWLRIQVLHFHSDGNFKLVKGCGNIISAIGNYRIFR